MNRRQAARDSGAPIKTGAQTAGLFFNDSGSRQKGQVYPAFSVPSSRPDDRLPGDVLIYQPGCVFPVRGRDNDSLLSPFLPETQRSFLDVCKIWRNILDDCQFGRHQRGIYLQNRGRIK